MNATGNLLPANNINHHPNDGMVHSLALDRDYEIAHPIEPVTPTVVEEVRDMHYNLVFLPVEPFRLPKGKHLFTFNSLFLAAAEKWGLPVPFRMTKLGDITDPITGAEEEVLFCVAKVDQMEELLNVTNGFANKFMREGFKQSWAEGMSRANHLVDSGLPERAASDDESIQCLHAMLFYEDEEPFLNSDYAVSTLKSTKWVS